MKWLITPTKWLFAKIRNTKEGRSQYVREKVSYRDAPARIYSEEESLEISSSHNPPSFSHSLALSLPAFLYHSLLISVFLFICALTDFKIFFLLDGIRNILRCSIIGTQLSRRGSMIETISSSKKSCFKSQGLYLDTWCVHCSNLFHIN